MPYFFRLPKITELTIDQQAAVNESEALNISGGPGTGKSLVSLWRHVSSCKDGKKSLLLTYTKSLEAYLKNCAASENEQAGKSVDRLICWSYEEGKTQHYDEIIIDEAQDVSIDLCNSIKTWADSVSYGADDQQSLYEEKGSSETQLTEAFSNNNHYHLDKNFRNSTQILQFVRAVMPNMRVDPNQSASNEPLPTIVISKKPMDVIQNIIEQLHSSTHNIAILVTSMDKVNKLYDSLSELYSNDENISLSKYQSNMRKFEALENIHITTLKSSKGLEFDTVIIPEFHMVEWRINKDKSVEKEYYVALTRARTNLYVISDRVLENLEDSEAKKMTYKKVEM